MNSGPTTLENRLAIRTRPDGTNIGHMNWGKLLFMHWRVPVAALRPLVPERLTIDTHEGEAWVGIVPFTMWDVRPSYTPAIPGLSEMHELNVRTYVHYEGVPGVWFMSMDCNSLVAVRGARTFFHLPYYDAEMSLEEHGRTVEYSSRRTHGDAPPAEFRASYTYGEATGHAAPDSLDFFLTERYCLYSEHEGELYRLRIHHQKWPLRTATAVVHRSNLLEALGLPTPSGEPLLHYANAIEVDVWPLVRV
ncbi:MAG TPA: DUF2071 domain-containing protein [Pyrinomonadaceae bacterium]|nr:DUF2071 domain-containing protein [Pyrinomonadaceae bacterium]